MKTSALAAIGEKRRLLGALLVLTGLFVALTPLAALGQAESYQRYPRITTGFPTDSSCDAGGEVRFDFTEFIEYRVFTGTANAGNGLALWSNTDRRVAAADWDDLAPGQYVVLARAIPPNQPLIETGSNPSGFPIWGYSVTGSAPNWIKGININIGHQCDPTTTTTLVEETTTTTQAEETTTTQAEETTTTVQEETTTTDDTEVLPSVVTTEPDDVDSEELPFTGGATTALAFVAAGLLALGVTLVASRREVEDY